MLTKDQIQSIKDAAWSKGFREGLKQGSLKGITFKVSGFNQWASLWDIIISTKIIKSKLYYNYNSDIVKLCNWQRGKAYRAILNR